MAELNVTINAKAIEAEILAIHSVLGVMMGVLKTKAPDVAGLLCLSLIDAAKAETSEASKRVMMTYARALKLDAGVETLQ